MAYTVNMSGTTELDDSILTAYDTTVQFELDNATVFDGLVQTRVDIGAKSIEMRRYARLAAATTALSEYEDVSSAALADSKIVITPKEYGNVVTLTSLSSLETGGVADLVAAQAIGYNAALTQDKLAYNALVAGGTALSQTANIDAAFLDKIYNRLARENVQKINGTYVAVLHEDQITDLRASSAAGSWTDVVKYSAPDMALRGEVGMYRGFKIVSSNAVGTTGTGSATAYKGIFLGANAFGKAVSKPIETRFTGPFDKLARFANVGWYGVFDYAVLEPKAVIVGSTTASYND